MGSVVMNKRIFKEQTSAVGDIPFYKIGTFGREPDAYISRELFEEYKENYPYPGVGDILLSASGSIGRTVVYDGQDEYFQDSNIVWLKHDGRLENKFLKQFYSIVKWQGLEGSTIKRLYNKNILHTNISVPSSSEQVKIGYFFEKLDDTIALHQLRESKLKKLKKAYIQKLFPITENESPVIRFKEFNYNWDLCKLQEISNITMGQSPKGETYTNNPEEHILIQGNADMKNRKVVPRVWTSQVTKSANPGDIILSVRAPVGEVGITDYEVVLGRGVASLTGNEFLFQSLLRMKETGYWTKYSTGSTFESINSADLKNAEIYQPHMDEQIQIGELLETFDNLIGLQADKVNKLKDLKKGYLQKSFL